MSRSGDEGRARVGDDRLVVTDAVRIPRFELSETFSASGGPGGQHANKAATRVELVFDVATSPSIPEHFRQRAIERLGARLQDGCLTITASELSARSLTVMASTWSTVFPAA